MESVNTSDALVPEIFVRNVRAALLDRRHRFVFSGTFDLRVLQLSPIWRVASGAPFNTFDWMVWIVISMMSRTDRP
jgi:hypothetical protein